MTVSNTLPPTSRESGGIAGHTVVVVDAGRGTAVVTKIQCGPDIARRSQNRCSRLAQTLPPAR